MEFIDTDLQKLFNSNQYFQLVHIKYFLYQLFLGMHYMHSANIIHRDLKPANILVNEDCSLRIADFGLARSILENNSVPRPDSNQVYGIAPRPKEDYTGDDTEDAEMMEQMKLIKLKRHFTTHMQTRYYRAPEVILIQQKHICEQDVKKIGPQVLFSMDVWSIGCIMAELCDMIKENCPQGPAARRVMFPGRKSYLSGAKPSQDDQMQQIFQKLDKPAPKTMGWMNDDARAFIGKFKQDFKRMNFQQAYPALDKEGHDLLLQLLDFNPITRITVAEALQHPFFNSVRTPSSIKEHTNPEECKFEFEDMDLSRLVIRELMLDEIAFYHPELVPKLKFAKKEEQKTDKSQDS